MERHKPHDANAHCLERGQLLGELAEGGAFGELVGVEVDFVNRQVFGPLWACDGLGGERAVHFQRRARRRQKVGLVTLRADHKRLGVTSQTIGAKLCGFGAVGHLKSVFQIGLAIPRHIGGVIGGVIGEIIVSRSQFDRVTFARRLDRDAFQIVGPRAKQQRDLAVVVAQIARAVRMKQGLGRRGAVVGAGGFVVADRLDDEQRVVVDLIVGIERRLGINDPLLAVGAELDELINIAARRQRHTQTPGQTVGVSLHRVGFVVPTVEAADQSDAFERFIGHENKRVRHIARLPGRARAWGDFIGCGVGRDRDGRGDGATHRQ